ncbi:MAG: WD40 repeat domain-containing protein [Fusobacteriota bacterium]
MKKIILFFSLIFSTLLFSNSKLIREGHFDSVNAIAKYPFGQTAISVGDDENIFIWDLVNLEVIDSIDLFEGLLKTVAISPGGNYFGVTTDFGDAFIFDYYTKKRVADLRNMHTKQISDIVFTNNNLLISGSLDGTIKIYDISQNKFKKSISMPTNITALNISENGQYLAAGGTNGTVYLFSTNNFEIISSITEHDKWISSITFSPNNKSLAVTSWDTYLDIFLINSRNLLKLNKSIQVPTFERISSIDWSNDDRFISISSFDSNVYIFNSNSFEYKFALTNHDQEVNDVLFINGSEKIISGSFDTKLNLWNLQTQELLASFSGY